MTREDEKRTETLPALRVTAQTLDALKELAFHADRGAHPERRRRWSARMILTPSQSRAIDHTLRTVAPWSIQLGWTAVLVDQYLDLCAREKYQRMREALVP